MTEEEKDLLLKYLCMALPYGIMIKEEYGDYINVNLYNAHLEHLIDRISEGLDKLVLRPMSSMTEEEEKEIATLLNYEFYVDADYALIAEDGRHGISLDLIQIYTNWLLEHHFDFMRLIPKGLAIAVTKKNNPYKD